MMGDWKPRPNSKAGQFLREEVGVSMSEDFKRILALPRRGPLSPKDIKQLQLKMTMAFSRPRGTQVLRALQAQALYEIYMMQGGFCLMPVGSGKTIVTMVAPTMLGARVPLLLVPAQLLKKAQQKDYPQLRAHWRLHPRQVFCSHERLGHNNNKDYLYDVNPDVIIIDEAHSFKSTKSVRTKVLLRYIDDCRKHNRPLTLVCLSGSMTRNSIRDYWHLITRALPRGCPLPLSWRLMDQWANALDAKVRDGNRVQPGALLKLCHPAHEPETDPPITRARKGFRRRLVETPGVIATKSSGFGDEAEPGMEIHEREVKDSEIPDVIKAAFFQLRNTGEMPNGDIATDAFSMWRVASQLAFGYYTMWDWPGCPAFGLPPGQPDVEWLEKRANWHRVIRETLKNGSHYKPPLDSQLNVEKAFSEGRLSHQYYNEWYDIRERYSAYPNNEPPTKTIWVHDFALMNAAKLLNKTGKKTIVWTSSPSLGERLAGGLGIPYYGAGNDKILYHKQGPCVASVDAHGTGKDLQYFDTNILLGSLHGNLNWQQWMGRTHRPGQKADTVRYFIYLHAKELYNVLTKAMDEATYYDDTVGDPQKLTKATMNVMSDEEADALLKGTKPNPLWNVAV